MAFRTLSLVYVVLISSIAYGGHGDISSQASERAPQDENGVREKSLCEFQATSSQVKLVRQLRLALWETYGQRVSFRVDWRRRLVHAYVAGKKETLHFSELLTEETTALLDQVSE